MVGFRFDLSVMDMSEPMSLRGCCVDISCSYLISDSLVSMRYSSLDNYSSVST